MDSSSSPSGCGSELSRNASQSRSRLSRWLSCSGIKLDTAVSRGTEAYRAKRCCSARGTCRLGRSVKSNVITPAVSSLFSVTAVEPTAVVTTVEPTAVVTGAMTDVVTEVTGVMTGTSTEQFDGERGAREGLPEAVSESEGRGSRELRKTL